MKRFMVMLSMVAILLFAAQGFCADRDAIAKNVDAVVAASTDWMKGPFASVYADLSSAKVSASVSGPVIRGSGSQEPT